jgi:N-acetylglucosamine-6-sulfatase
MKSYRSFLILVVVIFFSCSTGNKELDMKSKNMEGVKPQNVIFILSDDHRWDFMGFIGKIPWLKTPAMDRLASEGVFCPNTYVTTSLCSPSRASILTGLYSHSHEVVDNQAPVPEDLIYFPQYIQEAGYKTAFFGKWHMGDHNDHPRPGFDHWESFMGQGTYYAPNLNINGKRTQYDSSTYITDLLTDHAIDWMGQQDDDKPFFIYLSHKAVHAEFDPAYRHRGLYEKETYTPPASYMMTSKEKVSSGKQENMHNPDYSFGEGGLPDWVKEQRYSWHGVDYMYHMEDSNLEWLVKRYCESLMAVDESIASVMEYLESKGLLESTMVIYMGDNGFSFGEHGLIDKRQFYEESAKVPFLIYSPKIFKGGQVENRLIQNIDVAPTILESFGIEKPDHMQGKSILALLKGEETEWRDRIFYEYYWEHHFPQTPTVHGVRTDKYKLMRYFGVWDRNELYDMENDPEEMNNLIDSPEHHEIVVQLTNEIYDWLESTNGMQIPLKRVTEDRFGDYRNVHVY